METHNNTLLALRDTVHSINKCIEREVEDNKVYTVMDALDVGNKCLRKVLGEGVELFITQLGVDDVGDKYVFTIIAEVASQAQGILASIPKTREVVG